MHTIKALLKPLIRTIKPIVTALVIAAVSTTNVVEDATKSSYHSLERMVDGTVDLYHAVSTVVDVAFDGGNPQDAHIRIPDGDPAAPKAYSVHDALAATFQAYSDTTAAKVAAGRCTALPDFGFCETTSPYVRDAYAKTATEAACNSLGPACYGPAPDYITISGSYGYGEGSVTVSRTGNVYVSGAASASWPPVKGGASINVGYVQHDGQRATRTELGSFLGQTYYSVGVSPLPTGLLSNFPAVSIAYSASSDITALQLGRSTSPGLSGSAGYTFKAPGFDNDLWR